WGARTFLEVGPGSRLTGLVGAILHGRSHQALALDASAGGRAGTLDLARVLAELAALGYPVRLTEWDPIATAPCSVSANGKPSMTVPLCGANYRKPRCTAIPARALEVPQPAARKRTNEPNEVPPVPQGPNTAPRNGTMPPAQSAAKALPLEAPAGLAQALQ